MSTKYLMVARHGRAINLLVVAGLFGAATLPQAFGQIRVAREGSASVHRSSSSRTTTTRTTTSVHASGTAVHGRGAVVKGEEGYAAVGRRGAVVKGEEGFAAVGRRGAVVAGEEGVAAVGRRGGVVVGRRYENYEAWRVVAGVGAAIAVGTMLARPPTAATTLVVRGTTYWVYQNTYYMRVYSGGAVAYQVVARPL